MNLKMIQEIKQRLMISLNNIFTQDNVLGMLLLIISIIIIGWIWMKYRQMTGSNQKEMDEIIGGKE